MKKKLLIPTLQKAGLEIILLEQREIERMRKACAPVWDQWLAENGNRFNGLGKKMFDIYVKHVGKP